MTSIQNRIGAAYSAVYALACRHNATEYLSRSLEAARADERGHRAMGARFTRQRASDMYRIPVADAARYFAVRWALDDSFTAPTSWCAAADVREDTMYGLAARDRLRDSDRAAWEGLRSEYADVLAIDYSEQIARKSA